MDYPKWFKEYESRIDDLEDARREHRSLIDQPWIDALRERLECLKTKLQMAKKIKRDLFDAYEEFQDLKEDLKVNRIYLDDELVSKKCPNVSEYDSFDCKFVEGSHFIQY